MSAPRRTIARGRLFRKYVAVLVTLVSGALLASGLTEIYFSYQENKSALVSLQREKAVAAAVRIEGFIKEIERQIGWVITPQLALQPGAVEQRRFDYVRLLRQVQAITEVSFLDAEGREQLRVSRLAMDVVGSQTDHSQEPKFTETRARRIYYGPVYFRKESEPYMTLALSGSGEKAGVVATEINLKFIWDVVSQIKVGKAGTAYVVDGRGALVAHPDISLVLQKTSLASLEHVAAAIARSPASRAPAEEVTIARDLKGQRVLTAAAPIVPLQWTVLVDQPLEEAFEPLRASIQRTVLLMLLGVALAVVAGLLFARRMVTPIRALQAGAARIGAGNLTERLDVRTGDELEALAGQFNSMASQLQESYAGLEQKVDERTRELSESLEQQTATSEILGVISSSPTDLRPTMETIAKNAARICGANDVIIQRVEGNELVIVAWHGRAPTALTMPVDRDFVSGRAVLDRVTIHVPDFLAGDWSREFPGTASLQRRREFRTILVTPLLREGTAIGVIVIHRTEVAPFTDKQVALLQTFADQAVIAIENVRLFNELRARTADLARSVEELKALGEVGQAVSSTLDLQTVLTTIVGRAVQLSGTSGGVMYEYDEAAEEFRLTASHSASPEMIEALEHHRIRLGEGALGRAAATRAPVQVPDVAEDASPIFPQLRPVLAAAGFRSLLAIPLLREHRVVGGLVAWRTERGQFSTEVVNLLQTLATQSVLAIQNARLFHEIEEKGRQLEIASKHKSQFLANMSHELRTPLNAILGYTELVMDDIYGEVPEKIRDVLERVEKSGRHLLGLINDVLDLSKIEAGQLTLALTDYSLKDVVQTVFTAVESLAAEKQLGLKVTIAPDLPRGRGDERRLTQVLLNLVGNAIKFTEAGEVKIQASANDGTFLVSVSDTGPGIAAEDQQKIFDEFQQADSSSTRKKGGTGLGLSIARRIVALHGGQLWVESDVGKGSTFRFTVPVQVER